MQRVFKRVTAAALAIGFAAMAQPGFADQGYITNGKNGTKSVATGRSVVVEGERYIPTIWVDPDGCEHWVMDDGVEGYMTPNVRRDGTPVCREVNLCGVINTDQYFATDSSRINTGGTQRLEEFFRGANARAYIVAGHTDARASDEYNMRLSLRRANAVARVGLGLGSPIIDVRGYGERQPKATNSTAEGMAQNRRVEVFCIR